MKYSLRYPTERAGDPRLLAPEMVAIAAQAAEQAGFDGIAFTDHPAPSVKWLFSGGHESLDPLTALSFVAGVTRRIRLLTYLLVLPYRNPLLSAKQAATVDVLSGGRLTLTIGSGYLRSEFLAMGVDFLERNQLFDEAVDAMIGAWRTPGLHFVGRHFTALAQTQLPEPVQEPHPPMWVGGNSRASRQRVARFGQGWAPVLMKQGMASTTRTTALQSPAQLARAITEVRQLTADAGREHVRLDVHAQWGAVSDVRSGYGSIIDAVGQLAEAGATWVVFEPPGIEAGATIDAIHGYGEAVIGN